MIMVFTDSWSEYYKYRLEIKRRYKTIWDIGIVKKEFSRLAMHINDRSRVLEIGASDRKFLPMIRKAFPGMKYNSMDVDRQTEQDFYTLEEITGQYDFVCLFEVVEHLTLEEDLALFKKSYHVLEDGGIILAGTPNLFHPHRYWDSTHKTPLRYDELGALMMMAGFRNIQIFRMYNDSFLRKVLRFTVGLPLHKFLDIDFAKTILVEGRK
ncbi:MAG: methyltransferase domain-containing protein [Nitrospirae bacterium]|nr:methyltransferase domain-containing protein [Nitrospirota bacterium]